MKKIETIGKKLSKKEQLQIKGGTCFGACNSSYSYNCIISGGSPNWCVGQAKTYCTNLCAQL